MRWTGTAAASTSRLPSLSTTKAAIFSLGADALGCLCTVSFMSLLSVCAFVTLNTTCAISLRVLPYLSSRSHISACFALFQRPSVQSCATPAATIVHAARCGRACRSAWSSSRSSGTQTFSVRRKGPSSPTRGSRPAGSRPAADDVARSPHISPQPRAHVSTGRSAAYRPRQRRGARARTSFSEMVHSLQ